MADEKLKWEFVESKRLIENVVGRRVTDLAFPAGEFDDRVVAIADGAGYLGAWKKGGGPVQPGHDPLRLPRIRVHGRTTMEDFERKVLSGLEARKYGLGPGSVARGERGKQVSDS